MQVNAIDTITVKSYGTPSQMSPTMPAIGKTRSIVVLQSLAVLLFLPLAGVTFMPNSERAIENSALTTPDSAPLVYRLPALLSCLVAGVLIARYAKPMLKRLRQNTWVITLILLLFASAVWSQEPTQSLKSAVFFLLYLAITLWFTERFTSHEQMEVIMAVGILCAFMCIAVAVLAPDLAHGLSDPTAWQGVFYSKNHCGRMMLFLLLPAFHYPWRLRTLQWAYVCFILLIIGMSKSTSAWLLTITYGIYLLAMKLTSTLNQRSRRLVLLFSSALALGLAFWLLRNLDSLSMLAGKDMVLTGRPLIWKALLGSVMKRPIDGYGYDAFWTGQSGEGFVAMSIMHAAFGFTGQYAHNGYLDIALQLGALGLTVLVYSMLRAVKLGWACLSVGSRLGASTWYLGIIYLSVLYNTVEVTFFLPKYLPWMMYIFALVGLSDHVRRMKSQIRHVVIRRPA